MSFEFLTPAPSALARSPMERQALAAGARLERRDGWNVAVAFAGEHPERERCRTSAGFADRSHLGKAEIQGSHGLPLGQATRRDDAWWCPFTPEKALVLCEPANTAALLEHLEATFARTAIRRPGSSPAPDCRFRERRRRSRFRDPALRRC